LRLPKQHKDVINTT